MARVINKYKIINNDEGYVASFYAVLGDNYDYEGQMADFPEATEGWMKFENGTFVVDEVKKAEIIAEREKEAQKPTAEELAEAQMLLNAEYAGAPIVLYPEEDE